MPSPRRNRCRSNCSIPSTPRRCAAFAARADLLIFNGDPLADIASLQDHAKVALVVRRDGTRLRRFVHIGTGNFNVETAKRYSKAVFPGALTPTEVLTAWQAGADAVKIFPSDLTGPGYLKALAGPFPQIRMMPTGGVNAGCSPPIANAKKGRSPQLMRRRISPVMMFSGGLSNVRVAT